MLPKSRHFWVGPPFFTVLDRKGDDISATPNTQTHTHPDSSAVSCTLKRFAITTAQTHLIDMLSNTDTQRLARSYLHNWTADSAPLNCETEHTLKTDAWLEGGSCLSLQDVSQGPREQGYGTGMSTSASKGVLDVITLTHDPVLREATASRIHPCWLKRPARRDTLMK